ncbi:MAG: putative selenate reductase subunit YgfK [Clostridiales bacterium]|nr:putative selenate reductase subunit YgfK [Clostridiales bacterium]
MSERMTPMVFEKLINWAVSEYAAEGSMFGVRRPYLKKDDKKLSIFGEYMETPFGPAAGPNTQLAQNIIAAYFAGSRFFELKTVQIMDGDELAACIARPCILANDEGYNCEWSTELFVSQALDEYVKAWLALKVFSKKYGLGSPDGFIFNMSVGYDLDGIKSKKIDDFIEGLKNAENLPQWEEYKGALKKAFPEESGYIDAILPKICTSATLSTLHGCPPQEIERIAAYLISEKKLNTFVKCNPTILGYDYARKTLDDMGYDYIAFDDRHFREDLQYSDAVPMFTRLKKLAEDNGLEFGLKLSNTFPVDVEAGELPSEEMYMSGKALYPLTIEMANRISAEFDGKMRISYSGGADYFNIDKLFEAGIWPITVATTILKPGGYQRLTQIAEKLENCEFKPFDGIDCGKVKALSEAAKTDIHHVKPVKPLPNRKLDKKVPLTDCFTAPCKGGCPIGQDIPEYVELCGQGRYLEALKVITAKNPLPFITGTICAHHCMDKCTRNFYENPVMIRSTKLTAAENAYDMLMDELETPAVTSDKKAAIVGGGPAGMAAAYFLGKAGIKAVLFEKESKLGGIVRNVIPDFRISGEAIDKDAALIEKMGAEIRLNTPAPSLDELKSEGFTHVLYCVGAEKPGRLDMEGNVINVMEFLKNLKAEKSMNLGKNVAVIGGGNTAMDAARAAKRAAGVENVSIVYRRTKKYMPADEEELMLAIYDGVEFVELAAPVRQGYGILTAKKMKLGEPDESGRRSPVETDEEIYIKADTVIAAVGESVDSDYFKAQGIETDRKGRPSFKTNIENVYAAGDALRGPCTVVECIADAKAFAEAVSGMTFEADIPNLGDDIGAKAEAKKGILKMPTACEAERCLACNTVCENCVDVCPNRANVVIKPEGMGAQILHMDKLCNECGNCAVFCPYDSKPYRDKFTLFACEKDFEDSENSGFLPLGNDVYRVRLNGKVMDYDPAEDNALPKELEMLILTVKSKYGYMID